MYMRCKNPKPWYVEIEKKTQNIRRGQADDDE